MVLKTKPWKSGTNKLSLSRQFRAACKKLERLNLTFLRTQFIFRKGQGIYWNKIFARKGPLPLPNRFLRPTRVHLAQSGTSGLFWVFSNFWNQKRVSSSNDIMCSSKYVDFYAFPFAMRPSGANANAQLILPGEKKNYSKSSDNFYLKLPPKNAKLSKCKTIKFLPLPDMQWDWYWQK